MRRKAATLVEGLVVLAIIATLVGLLLPAILASAGFKPQSAEPPETSLLHTVRHDGHLWVLSWRSHSTHFVHHPDCPCQGKQAERAY